MCRAEDTKPIDVTDLGSTTSHSSEEELVQAWPPIALSSVSQKEQGEHRHMATKKEKVTPITKVEYIQFSDLDEEQQVEVREMLEPYKTECRRGYAERVYASEHRLDIAAEANPHWSEP